MNDPNRPFKWLLVITLVVLSIAVLYPPSEKLKGGIDLVGGSSLLYEIDTTGLDPAAQRDLSTRVMRVLKDRVDPEGQMNLEWRPVGGTRLEIRMPRPPAAALARRAAYNRALDAVQELNISRRDVEEALNDPQDRASRLAQLARGIEERKALIDAVAAAHDEYTAAQAAQDAAAAEAASKKYEEAMSSLLATSLPINRLRDVLALPPGEPRDKELAALRSAYPSYDLPRPDGGGKLLTAAIAAYDEWATNKAELEDPSDLKRRLRGAGVLEFRILAERDPSSPDHTYDPTRQENKQPISKYSEQLQRYGPRTGLTETYAWFPVDDVLRFTQSETKDEFEAKRNLPGSPIIEEYAGRYYVLMYRDLGLLQAKGRGAKWSLKAAYPDRNPMTGENVVSFQLDAVGGKLFGELTGANTGRQLCILLDGAAMSHATIRERITERCQISGNFSTERVQDLVNVLEAGSLPARLKETPLYEQTVGPSLGETNRRNGLQASIWGAVFVAVFMIVYYGVFGGGGATIALTLNLLFTLAIMSLMQATFTMPGIAGLLLSIGMAIDANVLIFERIREERTRGVPFKKALLLGYDKAFSAILDGNVTTIITCVILGFVGSEEIKGFAITLGIGIAISLFTALTVTRLLYTQLVTWDVLRDFSMRKLIGVPDVDWYALRRVFWPISMIAVVSGLGLFLWMSTVRKQSFFDIEFLGGTSVQLDLKPGVEMSDDDVREAITSSGSGRPSAVSWIQKAASELENAEIASTPTPSQFSVRAADLTGDQIAVLIRTHLTRIDPETGKLEELLIPRDGIATSGNTALLNVQPGKATLEDVKEAVQVAAAHAREAADKLRAARVQTVSAGAGEEKEALSFEVVTVETNRPLVQEAILAVLGDRLAVQQAVGYRLATDEDLTKGPYFVIEGDDHYLSETLQTEEASTYDVRHYRGGVAVDVTLEENEPPMTIAQLEERIRQVGLQPEFDEHFRTRETTVFGLGASVDGQGGPAYKHFAVVAVDESLLYDDNPVQWAEVVASSVVRQVEAALSSEKSLSKVVQFAPQIAGQTTTRAVFATILAMLGIAAYVWFRFGTRDYGLAIMVTMVHDVCLVLGLVAASHWIHDTFFGSLLGIDDFRFDLTMLAAVLTIIGYQLNDTIVVFDRIRENLGRSGVLSPGLVNTSINQTMSRTILTASLVTITVLVLYIFGGAGIHGFAYAMLVGTLVGTYSTVAIAVPLVCTPHVLYRLILTVIGAALIGLVALTVPGMAARLVIAGIIALAVIALMVRAQRAGYMGRAAGA